MKMINKNDFLSFIFQLKVSVEENQMSCLQRVVEMPGNTYDITVLMDMDKAMVQAPVGNPQTQRNAYDMMPQLQNIQNEGLAALLADIKDLCLKGKRK